MKNFNIQIKEITDVTKDDFVCILGSDELEALSNDALSYLSDIYRREILRFVHLDKDHTFSQGRKVYIDTSYVSAMDSCCYEINHILSLRKTQPVVHFFDQDCDLLVEKYGNGTTSLRLFSGGPVATATVCLPEVLLPEGYVLIKDFDENSGVLSALVFSGIVKDTGQTYPVGSFNHANFCRLTL